MVEDAKDHVRKRAITPAAAAAALARLGHATHPRDYSTINYSWPMRIAACAPQALLDALTARRLRPQL